MTATGCSRRCSTARPATDAWRSASSRPDGSVVWGLLALALVRDGDGRPRFFISQTEDITDRKNAQREIERLATIDGLTGLPNRLLLMDRLRHALALARRSGWLVGVVSIDLDRFKEVNDTYGHEVGDDLLARSPGGWTVRPGWATPRRASAATSS